MLRPEVRHIFQTGRPTNFKLGTQTEREDPHQTPWPQRSKVKVARSRDASNRFWPISRERNVLGTPKLVGRLSTSHAITPTSLKVKGQRSSSTGRIMLKVKVNFKLGRRLVNALSSTMAGYKGLCSWVIARGRGIPCRPHPRRPHNMLRCACNWFQKVAVSAASA